MEIRITTIESILNIAFWDFCTQERYINMGMATSMADPIDVILPTVGQAGLVGECNLRVCIRIFLKEMEE